MKQSLYHLLRRQKGITHENTIDWLADRLLEYNNYYWIKQHFYYNKNQIIGEVDVLAYNKKNNFYHFYEVKTHNSRRSYVKALRQYHRYLKAHPEQKIKGVYVTPKRIKRIK